MATSTSTQAPGGAKGPFPPFNSETFASQLVWLTLSFVILYVLMAKVALPRIGGIIESRRARIADDLAQAERLKAESDAALAAHEKALADARARAHALSSATRDKEAAKAEQTRKALEAQLHGRLAEAEKSIAATKTAAMANVESIAADAAAAIVQRLTGTTPSPDALRSAVASAVKR
jgi:F-type H+-transporting ATPase subunit b